MKNTLKYFILLFVSSTGCNNSDDEIIRQEMPFEKYGFVRHEVTDKSFEFLMGNGEMGGRVHFNGLGLEKIWFSDYWKNSKQRQFLPGILLLNDSMQNQSTTNYSSALNIDKALCVTDVNYASGIAYHAELYFSFDDVHLVGLSVQNLSTKVLTFDVILPIENFNSKQIDAFTFIATNRSHENYNSISWALRSNLALKNNAGVVKVSILPNEKLEMHYSVATQYDSQDHQKLVIETATKYSSYTDSYEAHYLAWNNIRKSIGSILLPDSDYAKWFYRSIYTNYATAGSKQFLAAETQFAYPEVDWDMHAFTYGHGVWAALSFIQMGDSVRAKSSLEWLYQPESLRKNVTILIPDTGKLNMIYRGQPVEDAYYFDEYPKDAFAFAHEQTDFGLDITYPDDTHWDLQFHVNGFASSVFHRYAKYYNDPVFEKSVIYPVMHGTGTFWSSLLKQRNDVQGYFLPPMLSLSENIVKPSVLDAVLAAKWNLAIADEYERKYNSQAKNDFINLSKNLHIPQNDSIYLEYLNDPQQRSGGGYFGIRACAYLGFPLYEQISSIDKRKARTTLDYAWKRNENGKGMISFISNWFALTEAYLGNGNLALQKSKNALIYEDGSDTHLYEAFAYKGDSIRARFNPYFLTGYSSFSLVPISMALQSYNGTLYFFPAVPSSWNNLEFYDLPAEGGYSISGRYKGPNDFTIWIKKNNRILKMVKTFIS